MVTNRALTYISGSTPLQITTTELDLDKIYKPNEVVIKIHAADFNPVDFMLHKFANRLTSGNKPKTTGRDFAGEIVKMGSAVDGSKWAVGDRVCGLFNPIYSEQGTMRDYLVLDPSIEEQIFTKIPEFKSEKYSDYVLGAAWPLVFGTALQGFTNYGQKFDKNSKILVLGASTSVGYNVVKIAKLLYNVETVVGTCNSRSLERNKEAGYDILVAYDTEDIPKRLKEIIANDLKGEKFDLIYDCCGYSGLYRNMHDYLKPKSTNAQFVTVTGKNKFTADTNFLSFWTNIIASVWTFRCSYNYHFFLLKADQTVAQTFKELFAKGGYSPPIDSVVPLEEYQTAVDKMIQYKAKGKVIVSFE